MSVTCQGYDMLLGADVFVPMVWCGRYECYLSGVWYAIGCRCVCTNGMMWEVRVLLVRCMICYWVQMCLYQWCDVGGMSVTCQVYDMLLGADVFVPMVWCGRYECYLSGVWCAIGCRCVCTNGVMWEVWVLLVRGMMCYWGQMCLYQWCDVGGTSVTCQGYDMLLGADVFVPMVWCGRYECYLSGVWYAIGCRCVCTNGVMLEDIWTLHSVTYQTCRWLPLWFICHFYSLILIFICITVPNRQLQNNNTCLMPTYHFYFTGCIHHVLAHFIIK